ncbi:MAG: ShlB/FhaC/HecB family hemolysin secretion/activation protein [Bacillota bacterium]
MKKKVVIYLQENILLNLTILILTAVILLASISAVGAQKSEQEIYVSQIEVSNSEIIPAEEIDAVTFKYEDRMISLNELKELVNLINQIYRERGYITAQAVIPEQNVNDGIVKIRLIEGKIGQILLEGNEDTDDDFILHRISIDSGEIIKVDSLEDELFYFNVVNDINLKADLKAGEEFGTTDLVLNVFEPEKVKKSFFIDNRGRDETGIFRYGINYSNSSLTGNRDSLKVSAFASEGTEGGVISYSLPINRRGGRLNLSYNKNLSDILYGDFESISIEGEYEEYGAGISFPLIVKRGFKVDGAFEYNNKESDTYFSGINLLKTDIETYSITMTTQTVKENNLFFTTHYLMQGYADSGNNGYSNSGVSDEFVKYNGYFEKQNIFNSSMLKLNAYLQLTNNKLLPSSEQFSLGGMSTVRGFKEGKLTGDQGYYLSAELSRKFESGREYFVFLDHGGVFPYKGNEEDIDKDDYLTSTGQGINFSFGRNISAQIVFALPLDKKGGPRVHFSLQKNW